MFVESSCPDSSISFQLDLNSVIAVLYVIYEGNYIIDILKLSWFYVPVHYHDKKCVFNVHCSYTSF